MVIAAPLAIAGIAAVACALGFCAVGSRFMNRAHQSGAHCASHGSSRNMRALAPILLSAAACGVGMLLVLYLLPSS